MQKKKKKKPETKKKKEISNENGLLDHRRLQRLLDLKYRDINDELVRKHFQVQDLAALLGKLRKSKYNLQKNKIQVNLIDRGLRDIKVEIEKSSEQEKDPENPNEIVSLAENILDFNRQQQGLGLEILKLSKMLSRLLISLAQLKARNNSDKVKNVIRQLLLYSLYR